MSQSTNERSDDTGPGAEWREKGDRGKKKKERLTAPGFPTQMINKDVWLNTIFENSIQFFYAPF